MYDLSSRRRRFREPCFGVCLSCLHAALVYMLIVTPHTISDTTGPHKCCSRPTSHFVPLSLTSFLLFSLVLSLLYLLLYHACFSLLYVCIVRLDSSHVCLRDRSYRNCGGPGGSRRRHGGQGRCKKKNKRKMHTRTQWLKVCEFFPSALFSLLVWIVSDIHPETNCVGIVKGMFRREMAPDVWARIKNASI